MNCNNYGTSYKNCENGHPIDQHILNNNHLECFYQGIRQKQQFRCEAICELPEFTAIDLLRDSDNNTKVIGKSFNSKDIRIYEIFLKSIGDVTYYLSYQRISDDFKTLNVHNSEKTYVDIIQSNTPVKTESNGIGKVESYIKLIR